jgi:arylsulfatase
MVGLPQGDSPGRLNSSYSVGADINDADYQPPFRFTGTLNKLMIKLDRPQLSAEDTKSLEAAMRTKAISE